MINRPSLYTGRVQAGTYIRDAGLNMPKVEAISNLSQFREHASDLEYPFLVRNEEGHAVDSPIVYVEKPIDLQNPLIDTFDSPISMPWVNVQDAATGIYRKYRALVVADLVIPHHLQISEERITPRRCENHGRLGKRRRARLYQKAHCGLKATCCGYGEFRT